MNGDGLPDRVEKNDAASWLVYFNTGTGFSPDPVIWPVPAKEAPKIIWNDGGTKADVFDINGDGLPDRILATDHNAITWDVHFGTGAGFTASAYAWPNPSSAITEGDGTKIRDTDASGNLRVAVLDMNGDGLVDRVASSRQNGTFTVWPNTGMAFSPVAWTWSNPSAHPDFIDVESAVTVADLIDMDGDQLPDRVVSGNSQVPWLVYYSNADPANGFTLAAKPDLLSRIENGLVGSETLTYSASTKYSDASGALLNPLLPSPVMTLATSTLDDGRGTRATTTYTYAEGRYDAPTREFRGFGRVTAAGPAVQTAAGLRRAVSISTFNQSDDLKGTPSALQVFEEIDGTQALMRETINTYAGDPAPPYEALLSSAKTLTWDGQAGFRMTKRLFPAYVNGLPTEVIDLGEVTDENNPYQDGTGDERVTRLDYAGNGAANLLGLPSHVTVTTADPADLQSERWFYYDNLPLGDALSGLLTKTEAWLKDPVDGFTALVTRTFSHDAFGNAVTRRDPNGHVTTTEYDSAYHTFPVVTVLPPLSAGAAGFVITRSFDPALGVQIGGTDLNGNVARAAFDALGRPTGTFLTPEGGNEIALTQTLYHDTLLGEPDDGGTGSALAQRVETLRFTAASGGEILSSRAFFDGFGRTYRRESTGPDGETIVAITAYDAQGRVAAASTPFFAGTATLWTTTEHDALGRPVRRVNPDGTFLLSTHDRWETVDTLFSPALEPLSEKRIRRDAFGRVIAAEELNTRDPEGNAGPYEALYAYDPRGNLIAARDPLGNLTSIAYDSLNRKV
ncbi:MAG: toxin TcdB middle/N-terminal domain-containing protein, partial [Phycisphaerae bacterium]